MPILKNAIPHLQFKEDVKPSMEDQERQLYQAMESRYLRMLVLENLERYPKHLATHLVKEFAVDGSRLYKQIRQMVKEGILIAEGNTNARTYRFANPPFARALLARLKSAETEWRDYKQWRLNVINECHADAMSRRTSVRRTQTGRTGNTGR